MAPSASAARLRWVCRTPFGTPVEPEVYMMQASSPSSRGSTSAAGSWAARAAANPSVVSSSGHSSPSSAATRSRSAAGSTSTRSPESRTTWRSAASGNIRLSGTPTAPACHVPSSPIRYSGQFGRRNPTRSPGSTPVCLRYAAKRAPRSAYPA